MTDIEPGKDCCLQNLKDAKWVSRAKWVCPVCGKDVSVEFIRLQDCLNSTEAGRMTDTERDKINQTIHEARGLCWHNIVHRGDVLTIPRFWCLKCPEKYPHDNPDYTSDWSAWGEALEWAQKGGWWIRFIKESYLYRGDTDILEMNTKSTQKIIQYWLCLLNPLKGATALAEFIDKHSEYFKKEVGK